MAEDFRAELDQRPQKKCGYGKVGQDKAREFAGQKVKVTGRPVGKTIRVSTIEAAT